MERLRNITATCLIAENKVFKNGSLVWEAPGNADVFLDSIYSQYKIAYPKFHKMDKLCKLGFLAAEILLAGRRHKEKYAETETGLVLTNAQSSLDVDLKYVKTIQTGASPALFVYTLPNIVIGEISIRHHFKGENAFFVFKRFDGNFMAEYVNGLFDQQLIKACICGWVDILNEDFRAMLYLVETGESEIETAFTAENLNQLNQSYHG